MFLDFIKEAWLKKIVKRRVVNLQAKPAADKIRTVGVLLDDSLLPHGRMIAQAFSRLDVTSLSVQLLVHSNKAEPEQALTVVRDNDLGWNGHLKGEAVQDFLSRPFDLLLHYYERESAVLLSVSEKASSKLRAGLESASTRLNQILIHSDPSKPDIFIAELFRYLKLLNRI